MREDISNTSTNHSADAAITAAHLLHPGNHFGHPREVLAADNISHDDKRAILASWASDIFAVESVPALRLYPGTDKAVSYDEIVEALKALDAQIPPREEAWAPFPSASNRSVTADHRLAASADLACAATEKEAVADSHSRFEHSI